MLKRLGKLILKLDSYAIKFLQHIKVYIETIVAVCLSILTIRITKISNDLDRLALLNDEKKNMPTFVLKEANVNHSTRLYYDLNDLDQFTNNTYRVEDGTVLWNEINKEELFAVIGEDKKLVDQYYQSGEAEFIKYGFQKIMRSADDAYEIYNSGSHQITNFQYFFNTYLFLIKKEPETEGYSIALVKMRDKYKLSKNGDGMHFETDDDIRFLVESFIEKKYEDTFWSYDSFKTVGITYNNYKGDKITEIFLMNLDDEILTNMDSLNFIDLSASSRMTGFEDITSEKFWETFMDSADWRRISEQDIDRLTDILYP